MSTTSAIDHFSEWFIDHRDNLMVQAKADAQKNDQLRAQFQKEWPLDRIPEMTVDDYIIGKQSHSSFCYQLEFGKYKKLFLGIGGGTSRKFGLYYDRKGQTYYNASNQPLTEQEVVPVFDQLKTDLVEIIKNGLMLDFDAPCFDRNKTQNLFFTKPALTIKLLCAYSQEPIFAGINTARDKEWNQFTSSQQHGGPYKQNYEIVKIIQERFPELDAIIQSYVQWHYLEFLKKEAVQQVHKQESNYKIDYSKQVIENKNVIFRGAPGTGKSYLAKEIAADIVSHGATQSYLDLTSEQQQQIEFVQFHPSYDYTDFVEGLRPKTINGAVGFDLEPGIFMKFVNRARENKENSQKSSQTLASELTAQKSLDYFLDNLDNIDAESIQYQTVHGTSFGVYLTDEQNIEIIIPNNQVVNHLTLKRSVLLKMLAADQTFKQVKDVTNFFNKTNATQHYSYYLALYKEIRRKSTHAAKIKSATEPLKNYVFIIDEINRGEISKIFGELFFSIDPTYRGPAGAVSTQYSNLHNLEDNSGYAFPDKFYIPENVYLIGTMNDIDRSVDTFDFAMRRRFSFIEITAEQSAENMLQNPKVKALMNDLNQAIISEKVGLSKDYQIGASYFSALDNDDIDHQAVTILWKNKLYPLLTDYFRGDYQATQKIAILENCYKNSEVNQ